MDGLSFDLNAFRDTFYQDGEDNRENENMLFDLFIETAERVVGTLKATLQLESEWSRAAHELKGASANLKAVKLADLCKQAEHTPASESDNRQSLLSAIETESRQVLSDIAKVMNS